MPEIVFQHALLDGQLRASVQVLHRATAAHAEMLATRVHTHHRGLFHLHQMGLLVARLAAETAIADRLAWQRALDEDHFARRAILIDQAADAARLHVEAFDLDNRFGRRRSCGGSDTRLRRRVGG
ncbi:hypothetical protein D3C81_1373160 [compost metagenome]